MTEANDSLGKSPQPPFSKGGLDTSPVAKVGLSDSPPLEKGGQGGILLRLRTALILGAVVIAAILWLPTPVFAIGMALVLLLAGVEWCNLAGLTQPALRTLYLFGLAAVMTLCWFRPEFQMGLLALGLLWWARQMLLLTQVRDITPQSGLQPELLLVGLVILVVPWIALVALHQLPVVGSLLVLFLMILIWSADSLAYFAGRRWGRTKLAPIISPGKTRAGVYGALAGAVICSVALALWLKLDVVESIRVLMICSASVVISVVGDLYESLLKRQRGLKDSGDLLPGHGGLLDRIDSLTAAAPLFALGMIWVFS
ncbi:phosphatidate cytidylyltransferase [Chromatium okenii]|uniref:Phosphatidate cytidylyltransferase n=1 Tax=Chromatium okenii TaxID=61644 RepID=A0A2S7XNP2_9GAMM|nr:phosphatidate cytidylyltransferase [Chromatium okenii]PQJ95367.1 phosphatidate cytidylyltransferase [Chromatium okenii]